MAVKLMLVRTTYSLTSNPFLVLSPVPSAFFPKLLSWTSTLSASSSFSTATSIRAQPLQAIPTPIAAASHGPSLRKGTIPPVQPPPLPLTPPKPISAVSDERDGDVELDEAQFTRVFDIAALRIPSHQCFEFEVRLRGHLLNWPRVRNIARVPGDEVDEDIQSLFWRPSSTVGVGGEEEEASKLLSRRIYGRAEGDGEELSPVLYRDKLVKEFNARGYTKFRNLAKMSRPSKRKKKKRKDGDGDEEEEGEMESRSRRRKTVTVEVVEERDFDCGGDLSELLGDEFKGKKWRGSTRLLLLDERYARREFNELPEAVKAILMESACPTEPAFELVRCKLTLFYDYWPMDEVLENLLPEGMIIPSAFESVGHIAHLNLRDEHLPYKRIIAKVVLDKNKPKIRTVVNKVDAISNDYRTMSLEVLAGNHSLVTNVIENGIRFLVDLATVYWNSRLATERQRLMSCFTCEDVVCDVFAGVGPIAIAAAKIVKRVYANDLNPYAVDYLERNSVLNRLERKIEVYNMDGRRFIDSIFSSAKGHSITQVVMNLPNDAAEYLDAFRGIFRNKRRDIRHKFPRIHVYGFSKAEDPEFDFEKRIRIAVVNVEFPIEFRRVQLVAPGKWMLCASFVLPESVAYGKSAQNM